LFSHIDLSTLYDNANDGDLIFFEGDSLSEQFIKRVLGTNFNHVGILIKEDGRLFIIESDVGQRYSSGPRIIPLEDKIKYYKGSKYIGYRPININVVNKMGLNINKDRILSIASSQFGKGFDNNMTSFVFGLIGMGTSIKDKKDLYCSEYVGHILNKLGIAKKRGCYSPKIFEDDDVLKKGIYNDIKIIRVDL
jgi:hypothetical protein